MRCSTFFALYDIFAMFGVSMIVFCWLTRTIWGLSLPKVWFTGVGTLNLIFWEISLSVLSQQQLLCKEKILPHKTPEKI